MDGLYLTNDPCRVANLFADNLEKIFSPHEDPSFNARFKLIVDVLPKNPFAKVESKPKRTSGPEIAKILNGIRGKGAPGPDSITNKVLKRLPNSFHYIMAGLINSSMKLGHISNNWKVANIIMIPKPLKDHTQVENFRPISLLNGMSKLAERVIKARIEDWITSKPEIISKYQCGFRPSRQTKDHILRLIQACYEAQNQNKHLVAIFIDIERAFDKIWHKGLIWLLFKHLCIPAYLGKWIVT
jgi:Reverse transcriptase (RNA-dependent DNA polymerase)